MPKIRFMSDVHLEFGNLRLKPAGEEILCLGGDIGIFTDGMDWADQYARKTGIKVVMICGNHEFYRNDAHPDHTMASTKLALREKAAASQGRVTFLERDSAVISGVRFIGTTLWTDMNLFGNPILAKLMVSQSMNDFALIAYNFPEETFTPDMAVTEHLLSREFLASALATPFDGPTVVMTHQAPSRRSISERYAFDRTSPAYASNLDEMVASSGAAIWQHGHIHESFDYMIGGTRVIDNPRGYAGYELNRSFDANLVIEV